MITNTASFDGTQSLVALVHNRLISVRLKLSTSNSSSAQCTHPLCAIVHNRHVRVRLKYSSCEPTSLQCSDDTQPLFASVHNRPVLVRLKLSKVEPTSAELSAFILHGRNGSVTALATAETEAANAKAKLQHKMRGLNTRRRGQPKLGRHIDGGKKTCDRKTSSFPYSHYQQQLQVPAANQQQISSFIRPKPRTPTKPALKRALKRKTLIVSKQIIQSAKLQKKCHKLDVDRRLLLKQLRAEKRASNSIINASMAAGRTTMRKAVALIAEASELKAQAEAQAETVAADAETVASDHKHKHTKLIRKERLHAKARSEKLNKRHQLKIKDLEAKWKQTKTQLTNKLQAECNNLAKQRATWQKRLKRLEALLHQRRSCRIINQHINKIDTSNNELQERIDNLEQVNFNIEQDNFVIEHDNFNLNQDNINLKQDIINLKQDNINLKQDCIDLKQDQSEERLESRKMRQTMTRVRRTSKARLDKMRDVKCNNKHLQDELIGVLKAKQLQDDVFVRYQSKVEAERKEMRLEWDGRGGGKWPTWVSQVICELLVNGTPPSAIPLNLQTLYETLYGVEPVHTPSLAHVRHCRVLIQIIGETISALKLASKDTWKQIFFDATTRRQVPFQALIIALMSDGKLDPIVVSSCIFMEDETAEKEVESIVNKINCLKSRLDRIREVYCAEYPDEEDPFPASNGLSLTKLREGGISSDSCTTAQKERRLLAEVIGGEPWQQDCHHHLRNVWFKAMEKALTTKLNQMMKDDLEEISYELRVKTSFSAVARAYDKGFSRNANYAKGFGEDYAPWLKKNKPREHMYHVYNAQGSRHDLCVLAAPAIYMNRLSSLEYMDEILRLPKKRDNILMRNLFCVLTSEEMVALSRLLTIVNLSICLPMRWLAAMTPKLAEYQWGAANMGLVLDVFLLNLDKLIDDPDLVLTESFMMSMFSKFLNELPPMKAYWDLIFKRNEVKVICRHTGAIMLRLVEVRDEAFNPTNRTNKRVSPRVITLGYTAFVAIRADMMDVKKATHNYLSCFGLYRSWKGCPDNIKRQTWGMEATNDYSESSLGGTTHEIVKYGRIGHHNAAAVSDARRNKYWNRGSSQVEKSGNRKVKNAEKGMFHQFSSKIQRCLMLVAIEDSPATKRANHSSLELQRKCREKKADLLKEFNLEKTKEDLLEATYYYRMYFSEACWKGDKRLVKRNLRKLTSKTAQLDALKENIRMRVKGCGFEMAHITWSFRRKQRSVKELADKLEWIIEWEKSQVVPAEPHMELPQRRKDATLGTQTLESNELDEKYEKKATSIRVGVEKLRRTREARGEGSIFTSMQPLVKPDLKELMKKRIDVLFPFDVDSDGRKETVLRWCQGVVIKVYENQKKPVVSVKWDAMPDVDGSDECTISDVILLPTKWKKDVVMAWRMDVEGDADDIEDSDCDSVCESDTDTENEGESEEESEVESETGSEDEDDNELDGESSNEINDDDDTGDSSISD